MKKIALIAVMLMVFGTATPVYAGLTYELIATTGVYGNVPVGTITIDTIWSGDDHFDLESGDSNSVYSFSIAGITFAGSCVPTNAQLASGGVFFGAGQRIGDAVLTPTYISPSFVGWFFKDLNGNQLSLYADSIGNDWVWGNNGDYAAGAGVDWYLKATTAPVPIPAAVWLLGSGLIGLVGLRRKFKK